METSTIGVLGVFTLGFVAGIVFWHWMVRLKKKGVGSQIRVPAVGFDSTSEPKSSVCRGCGCLIAPHRSSRVRCGDPFAKNYDDYCGRCKPPYDRVNWESTPDGSDSMEFYFQTIPEHEIRVNEDGSEWKGPDEGG